MEHLLPPQQQENLVKGCELVFPDTAFYEKGKAKVVVKMDREYCLTGVRKATRLTKDDIYKDFSNVVRERKKDGLGLFYMKYGPEACGRGQAATGKSPDQAKDPLAQSAAKTGTFGQEGERAVAMKDVAGSFLKSMRGSNAMNFGLMAQQSIRTLGQATQTQGAAPTA
jgi:hypothetical protein